MSQLSPAVRSFPLRRVIPLARSVRCGKAVIDFLSIEDLLQEFVIRLAVHDPLHWRSHEEWCTAQVVVRDRHSTTYRGEIASAVKIPGGIDLAVSCWPILDPAATLVDLTFGPADWGVSLLAALDPGAPGQVPSSTGELELSVASARAVELATHTALVMGAPMGPEHLLLSIVRAPDSDELRNTLQAVNLRESRIQPLLETLVDDSPDLGPAEFGSALCAAQQAAARLADVCVRPEHLLLGLLLEDGTRVNRLLLGLGIPPHIVYGLLDAQLASRAPSMPDQRVLRSVVAVDQIQTTLRHTLALMSIEDYATGFVVRGHVDSSVPRLDQATRDLELMARDDAGGMYMCNVIAATGYGTGAGCTIDVAWTSTCQLATGARMLELSAPALGCTFTVPLQQATRVRHA